MHIIIAHLLALATLAVADMHSVFPRQTIVVNATTTTTATATITPENPVLSSVIFSCLSAYPSTPSEIQVWESAVDTSSVFDILACPPASTLLPTSLHPIYAGFESDLSSWYSIFAAGIGGIQTVDPQDVDDLYSLWMMSLCPSYTAMFSSVFHAAAATSTATATATEKTTASGSTSGASSAWTVSVLGAALAGMLGVVVTLS